jgi:hypothetical protein
VVELQRETNSAASVPSLLSEIQRTVSEFLSDCQSWEREIDTLLVAIDSLESKPLQTPDGGVLADQQERMIAELIVLRGLVEERNALFAGLTAREPAAAHASQPQALDHVLTRIQALET